ncbi:Carboxyvinyl-carboxyphosphonate phosphorylmutase [Nymphaea thermarum]|nr:Carboxyvinyl-carboxyphosphonate phosphorylmutase [Nymphaea thermarum]
MAGILTLGAALRSKAGRSGAALLAGRAADISAAIGSENAFGRRSFCSNSSDPPAGRSTRIQQIIEKEGVALLPGCYDALSAAIVQKVGFSAGFISGYSVSAARLGKPDIGLMTPPEMAEAARTICSTVRDIPFIADADTGGGNSLNVQRTVKDLIAAGAAGCFLEDQAWPKKCGIESSSSQCHMRGKQVIPAEEHAAKIAAARDAIGDSDFFLIARTDARAISEKYGLSEAISRANLYMEAGADACFVDAPRSDDELREIARRTNGFRVVNMIEGGVTPLHTQEELKEMGFHIILHSTTTLYTTARALMDMLQKMKESGSSKDHLDKLASFAEFNRLINIESYFAKEAHFAEYKNALEAQHELKASSGAF